MRVLRWTVWTGVLGAIAVLVIVSLAPGVPSGHTPKRAEPMAQHPRLANRSLLGPLLHMSDASGRRMAFVARLLDKN
jgi:hypothetical protein